MADSNATPSVCVVCKIDSQNLVVNPGLEQICDILHYANRLVDLGEVKWRPLSDHLSSLSQSELEQVRYHSDCRKIIVNKPLLERAEKRRTRSESLSPPPPAKRGRPAKSSVTGRPQRHTSAAPRDIVCMFALPPYVKCKYHEEELHRVESDNRGQTLLDIKANTMDDHIRASLSTLH